MRLLIYKFYGESTDVCFLHIDFEVALKSILFTVR